MPDEQCDTCHHAWHGLACLSMVYTGSRGRECDCAGPFGTRIRPPSLTVEQTAATQWITRLRP